MIRSLRNLTQTIFFKIFLVLVILGFAVWGVGDLTGQGKTKPIFKTEKFEVNYQQVIKDFDLARKAFATPLNIDDAIKNGVLNQVLINHKTRLLTNEEAANKNLTIPRNILKNNISEDKAFQDNNKKFSATKFKRILIQNQLSEENYLALLSSNLIRKHLVFPIKVNQKYNNMFSKKFFDWENKTLDIKYNHTQYIKKEKIKKPSDISLNEYYKKNKSQYFLPELRNFSFLLFEPKNFMKEVDIPEQKIKELYDERIDAFKIPEKRNYLQIIFSNEIEASNFYNSLNTNISFEKAAKELNYKIDDILIENVAKFEIQKELEKLVFNAKKNESLKPIKTNFGYHVIKIKDIIEEKITKYNEIRLSLLNELKNDAATELLYEYIDEINDMVFSGNTLIEISKKNKSIDNLNILKINNLSKSGFIFKNNEFKHSKLNNKFVNEIWKANIDEVTELIEIDQDKYVLIYVEKEIKKQNLNFLKAKPIVLKNYLLSKIKEQTLINAKLNAVKEGRILNSKKVVGLSRFKNNALDKTITNDVVNRIFEKINNNINYIETDSGILTYKITKEYVKNKIKENDLILIERNFNNSFNSDLENSFYELLESSHNLKTNFSSLNQLVAKN